MSSLPVDLQAPVAGLSAAVQAAAQMVHANLREAEAPRSSDFTVAVRLSPHLAAEHGRPMLATPHGANAVQVVSPGASHGRPISVTPRGANMVQTQVSDAALVIASALDRYLPKLVATVDGIPATGRAEGCDLVSQLPYLCVGSAAANTYTDDAALLVDLGGDDVYHNAAGAVPVFANGSPSPAMASVNIDLGGDDAYSTDFAPRELPPYRGATPVPFRYGQGAAVGIGVGMLVDLAGDDEYTVRAPTPKAVGGYYQNPIATALGQGAAVGQGSVGILFDQGGRDLYSVLGPAEDGTGTVSATGQGASIGGCDGGGFYQGPHDWQANITCVGGGGGFLFDTGDSSDAYRLDSGVFQLPASASIKWPLRLSGGQGAAWGHGPALLYDDGGEDSFSCVSSTRNLSMTSAPEMVAGNGAPMAAAVGQGSGLLAQGWLLAGAGDTNYQLMSHSDGLAVWNYVAGHGEGVGSFITPGTGVLDDGAGDDLYAMTAHVDTNVEATVGDDCECDRSALSVYVGALTFIGQGVGVNQGTGILADHNGDDAYDSRVEQDLRVHLTDRLTAPTAPPEVFAEGFRISQTFHAQGVGFSGVSSAASTTAGLLVDAAGDDVYSSRWTSDVIARAESLLRSSPAKVVAASYGPLSGSAAQGGGSGGGVGGLLDLGATSDRFEAVVSWVAATEPDPDGAFVVAGPWPYLQGAERGVFVARSDHSEVTSTPSRDVITPSDPGVRGYGRWYEIGEGVADPAHPAYVSDTAHYVAYGEARGAEGSPSTLEFTPTTPNDVVADRTETLDPRAARLTAGAVLQGTAGSPLSERTVHFVLQAQTPGTVLGTAFQNPWVQLWQADALTDSAGKAVARIPLASTGTLLDRYPTLRWRLVATFDGGSGSPGVFPSYAVRSLTVSG